MAFSKTLQRLRRNKAKVSAATFEAPPLPSSSSLGSTPVPPELERAGSVPTDFGPPVPLAHPAPTTQQPKEHAKDEGLRAKEKEKDIAYTPQPIIPALIAASPRSSSLPTSPDLTPSPTRPLPSPPSASHSASNSNSPSRTYPTSSPSSLRSPQHARPGTTHAPYPPLPSFAAPVKTWRYLVLVTSVNSFAQKVITWFEQVGISHYAFHVVTTAEGMVEAAEKYAPDVVVCPFLTARIPEAVFTRWITLVVHPGPPGDAGPSSLDWVLMGDTGLHEDGTAALAYILSAEYSANPVQRSHWGTITFQANEELDGGAVWAWEQYPLPAIGSITKAQLYQGPHSYAALISLRAALIRVCEQVYSPSQASNNGVDPSDSTTWVKATPRKAWSTLSVTRQKPFLGGHVHDRPLLQSKSRRPDWSVHTARDVQRIIAAGDSQPGGQIPPITSNSKTALFAYGCHIHHDPATVPHHLYADKYCAYTAVPDGTVLAQRDGAVFIKTRQSFGAGAGVWITHGRLPKKSVKEPLAPKVPMTMAIRDSGHGAVLESLPVWEEEDFQERKGTWQAVYVRSVETAEGIAQLVYWNFYNGAFTTENCHLVVRAMLWATEPSRGNVKVLAMMGGNYFSNGIALNTIEASSDAGKETWANINAIDDVVEVLLGDTSAERSPFLHGVQSLTERGIVTVACLRGNAAAGGVAMAAGCDVVIGARGVVLNPAYRAMGLHGSEFHSYSYAKRCGDRTAAHLLKDMTPMSTAEARSKGLIDVEVASFDSTPAEVEAAMIDQVRCLVLGKPDSTAPGTEATSFLCAPWCLPSTSAMTIDSLLSAKLSAYTSPTRTLVPLVHYRTEELSQMLLDSFHPIRSKRYHTRREAFIRKYKSSGTAARYARDLAAQADEEDLPSFDDASGWIRGEEWAWAGMDVPASMSTSECLRVNLYPEAALQLPGSAADQVRDDLDLGRKGSAGSEWLTNNSVSSDDSQDKLPVTPRTPRRSAPSSTTTAEGPTILAPPLPTVNSAEAALRYAQLSKLHAPGPAADANAAPRVKGQMQMGMQGFEMPPALSVADGAGGKGDVMFSCLYQAEVKVHDEREGDVGGEERVGRAI